jgi:hypothetical protein
LRSVDLPAFGRPSSETNPDFIVIFGQADLKVRLYRSG